jgi:hypothetical protein
MLFWVSALNDSCCTSFFDRLSAAVREAVPIEPPVSTCISMAMLCGLTSWEDDEEGFEQSFGDLEDALEEYLGSSNFFARRESGYVQWPDSPVSSIRRARKLSGDKLPSVGAAHDGRR